MNLPNKSEIHVSHVTDTMAQSAGGVPSVMRQLVTRTSQSNFINSLYFSRGNASDLIGIAKLHKFPPSGLFKFWDHSPDLISSLSRNILSNIPSSLVHVHGCWTAPSIVSSYYSSKYHKPFLFSPHGQLMPWLFNKQGSKNI